MGLDLMLFMADWKCLSAIPVEKRIEALADAALRPPELDGEYHTGARSGGWVWLPDRESAWCAEYDFFTTTGAFRPHARAGMRGLTCGLSSTGSCARRWTPFSSI
ncbi:hypothetical protein [Streptomyces cirratus]|uniref:hypothetical protein n=1 Tax=Streptomyces cirratus TaxID=68187 RepID=UPI00360D40A9